MKRLDKNHHSKDELKDEEEQLILNLHNLIRIIRTFARVLLITFIYLSYQKQKALILNQTKKILHFNSITTQG